MNAKNLGSVFVSGQPTSVLKNRPRAKVDVTWTSTEDSLPTVHTLPEDGFIPEVVF